MKFNKITLRRLVQESVPELVYQYINKKDQRYIAKCDRPSMEKTTKLYTHVMDELLSKPKTRQYKYPIVVRMTKDPVDKKEYVEVCILNLDFVAPAKGLKPWGCKRGQKPPDGFYNVNDNRHSKYFAFGWVAWSKIIDTPVVLEGKAKKIDPWAIVGEILWEMTFYGWSEEDNKKTQAEMKVRFDEARKDIKEGKCIEIPPKKKGGYKIVIPDTVSKQIGDIFGKKK